MGKGRFVREGLQAGFAFYHVIKGCSSVAAAAGYLRAPHLSRYFL
jgi:hypothetical protein